MSQGNSCRALLFLIVHMVVGDGFLLVVVFILLVYSGCKSNGAIVSKLVVHDKLIFWDDNK